MQLTFKNLQEALKTIPEAYFNYKKAVQKVQTVLKVTPTLFLPYTLIYCPYYSFPAKT